MKILVPVAALLAASLITVSAAPGLKISDTFRSFFSSFFGTHMTDGQLGIIEKYGYAPDKTFSKDGVELSVEGIIGDENLLYIKYSVSEDRDYRPNTFYSILSPDMYIGDMKNRLQPRSVSKTSEEDKLNSGKTHYSAIYQFDGNTPISGKTATFVMKFPGSYKSAGINLGEIYKKHGISHIDSNDIYSIENSKLKLPFDNEFGKILLDSIGYVDGKLILAVDSSDYYEVPKLYLRNKKTNEVYGRGDNYFSVSRENLELYSFLVEDVNTLDNLEIVMLEEHHLSFPLSYVGKTITKDLSYKNIYINKDTKLNKLMLSPLSLNINGVVTGGYGPGFSYSDCALRLKDGTVLNNFKYSFGSSGNKDDSFNINICFEAPIEIADVDALIIKPVNENTAVEIPFD